MNKLILQIGLFLVTILGFAGSVMASDLPPCPSSGKNLMEGNGVPFKSPSTEVISKKKLSKQATEGTAFLSCWMTTAQIENMKNQKVFFSDLR